MPVAYAIPEAEAHEENLLTMFAKVQAKQDESVKVKKLSREARVPTKGSVKAAGHDLYANEGTDIPSGGQVIVGTGIAIQLQQNTYERIAPRRAIAVQYPLAMIIGVIDADYNREVKVVLANQGNQPYQVERGDRVSHLIIEKINNEELQAVAELEDTKRENQGFGSSNSKTQSGKTQSGKDHNVKSQSGKPQIEIKAISARAFGQCYQRGEEIGILRWDEVNNEIQLEAINVSTELDIKNKKNNEDTANRNIVPREYYHLLDVFEKGEKTSYHPSGKVEM